MCSANRRDILNVSSSDFELDGVLNLQALTYSFVKRVLLLN